jgi:ribosome-binding factor A
MVHRFDRASRVEDQILREVSNIVLHRVGDPRLRSVTITRVSVSRDLKKAVVFYSHMQGGEDALRDAARGLKSAKGYIKRELSARIRIKFLPAIDFEYEDPLAAGAGEVRER